MCVCVLHHAQDMGIVTSSIYYHIAKLNFYLVKQNEWKKRWWKKVQSQNVVEANWRKWKRSGTESKKLLGHISALMYKNACKTTTNWMLPNKVCIPMVKHNIYIWYMIVWDHGQRYTFSLNIKTVMLGAETWTSKRPLTCFWFSFLLFFYTKKEKKT